MVTLVFQVLTRRVKAGSVPPIADDSATLDESNRVREDSAPPVGVDINVTMENLHDFIKFSLPQIRRFHFFHVPRAP